MTRACKFCAENLPSPGYGHGRVEYCNKVCRANALQGRRKKLLTAERLKEVVSYDPISGLFHWLETGNARYPQGHIAGWSDDLGYVHIRLDGRLYLAHRLAWLYMTGEWPKAQVDHKDCIASNNVWKNLRESTQQQNTFNTRLSKANTSGFKGVSRKRKLWRATIRLDGKQLFLGTFSTPEKAHVAYAVAIKKHRGEFARAA